MNIQLNGTSLAPSASDVFESHDLVAILSAVEARGYEGVPKHIGPVDFNVRGRGGLTPLAWSVLRRSSPAITYLLKTGADPVQPVWEGSEMTPLHLACSLESSERQIVSLVEGGVNVDILDADGYQTPLVTSIMCGRLDSVRTLLALGADPNTQDEVGESPLHFAGGVASADTVLALLDGGADPEVRCKLGVTFRSFFFMTPDRVLTAAARDGRLKVSAWLSGHGYRVTEG